MLAYIILDNIQSQAKSITCNNILSVLTCAAWVKSKRLSGTGSASDADMNGLRRLKTNRSSVRPANRRTGTGPDKTRPRSGSQGGEELLD